MAATFEWLVEYMECKPTEGAYTDVVITVGWRCNGSELTSAEPDAVPFRGSVYGSVSLGTPSDPFTPYDQLTQEQVLNWCYANGVDQATTEASVQSEIDYQINPPVTTPPLPWAS